MYTNSTAAELVYGTTLRLPAEYFFNEDFTEPQIFLSHFRKHIRNVKSTPTAHHNKKRTFIHGILYTYTHVFVRVDRIKNSLESPQEGPYPVSERITDRIFKIIVNRSYQYFSGPIQTSVEAIPDEQHEPLRIQLEHTTNLKAYPGKRVSFATSPSRVT